MKPRLAPRQPAFATPSTKGTRDAWLCSCCCTASTQKGPSPRNPPPQLRPCYRCTATHTNGVRHQHSSPLRPCIRCTAGQTPSRRHCRRIWGHRRVSCINRAGRGGLWAETSPLARNLLLPYSTCVHRAHSLEAGHMQAARPSFDFLIARTHHLGPAACQARRTGTA